MFVHSRTNRSVGPINLAIWPIDPLDHGRNDVFERAGAAVVVLHSMWQLDSNRNMGRGEKWTRMVHWGV